MRNALLECFRETTCLVRPERRRQLVLVGGAASVAHSSRLATEDVDVAAPPDLLIELGEAVLAGAPNFNFESDGKIAFDAPEGFRVRVDLIELGGGCIERIHAVKPLLGGSVASMSDLLLFRAVIVVDRGSDSEVDDFRWLLSEVAKAGQVLPGLSQEELECLCRAGESRLGFLDRLLLAAVMGSDNATGAGRLFEYVTK